MNKKLHWLVLLLCCMQVISAQKKSGDPRKYMSKADVAFETEDFPAAWKNYKKVLAIDKTNQDAALNAAISAQRMNYSVDSIVALGPVLKSSSLRDAKFYYALICHRQKNFDEAITTLEKYRKINAAKRMYGIDEINYRIAICNNAKTLMANSQPSAIRNMGPAINSAYADYVPVIIPDESALFFTSKRPNKAGTRNGDNNYFEDVYVSYRENNSWKKAEPLNAPVNSETNDACVAVSADGQRMILYRTTPDGRSGDLFTTRVSRNNSWEPLQKMNALINSESIETSACFSNDSTEIYFSSDRPGGLGGKDLYRIKVLPNGKWSQPYNLGPNVNTPYDDDAPFLHPDGVTLYFSSKGHNTMGEYDVFKSVFDREKNLYSKAENLGYPINDVENDIFFVLSPDGQRGYYSSVKADTHGGMDIYEIDTKFVETQVVVRRGTARLDGQAGRVQITLTDVETGQLFGTYLSHPDHGRFIMVINPRHTYHLSAEAEGFQKFEKDLSGEDGTELEINLLRK